MENEKDLPVTQAKLEEAFQRFERSIIAALAKNISPEYLSTKQVAKILNVSYQYLEIQRCHGGGPPYVTLGKRAVRYLKSDVDAWATSQRKAHTSQSMPSVCAPARIGDRK